MHTQASESYELCCIRCSASLARLSLLIRHKCVFIDNAHSILNHTQTKDYVESRELGLNIR